MSQNLIAREEIAKASDHFTKTFPSTSKPHHLRWSKTGLGNGSVLHIACRLIPWLRCLKGLPSLWLLDNPVGGDCYLNSFFRLAQLVAAYPAACSTSHPDHQ